MSKADDTGSKRSKNKSGPVRPTVSNHDIPKVVSVDRRTEEDVDADPFNFADISTPTAKRKKRPTAADADAFDFTDVSTTAGTRNQKPADADAFNFADDSTPALSSANRKNPTGQRLATASAPRSASTQAGRGRGKSKKDVELMVAYGTLGAMALVAVIGLAVMLSGGGSAESNKSRNRGRSNAGAKYRDPSRYMQSTAEQRRLIEARRSWSRGDVAFPDADPNADEVEPVVTEHPGSGDFQLPPSRDKGSPIGAEHKPARQPLESNGGSNNPRRPR